MSLNKLTCFILGHDWDEKDPSESNGIILQERDCRRCEQRQARYLFEKHGFGVKWFNTEMRFK